MKETINLLPKEEGYSPVVPVYFNQFSRLAFSALIILELSFFAVLLLRLGLDRRILLLKSSLKQKQAIVYATGPAELAVRKIEKKLSLLRVLHEKKGSFLEDVKLIPPLIPNEVILNNLNVSKNRIELRAKTSSGASFAKMVDNLNRSSRFSGITLTSSVLDEASRLYSFEIETTFRGKEIK